MLNAAELSTYDQVKLSLIRYADMDKDSKLTHFIAAAIGGFMGAAFSSPADVIKSRYMNQLKQVK